MRPRHKAAENIRALPGGCHSIAPCFNEAAA